MLNKTLIFTLVFLAGILKSQSCKELFVNDSLFKPNEKIKVPVKTLNCALKNGGMLQLINNNGKYILKLSLSDKLGLMETGPLEIKSGNRSFFVKNATLYDIKESHPYFLIDVLINYIGTLKDDGINSVIFNGKFEAKLSREDSNQIKKTAKCFYEIHKN